MKTSDYTSSSSDILPKADGPLNKATMVAHGVVDKATGAAEDAARKATPAIDRTAGLAHRAVDSAAAAVAPAAEWLNEQAMALNAAQKKLVDNTREYVAANPLMSLGMAVAAGFLISRILRK